MKRFLINEGYAFLLILVFVASGCTPQGDPAIGRSGFNDAFDRTSVGDDWNNTGGPYEIQNGMLHIRGAHNKPLWLKRVLPRDVRVEFDVRSDTPDGDIKVELFGDGVSRAETASYTATSYVVIFGGWNNSLNVLARMNEHGADRVVGPVNKVTIGHTYRMKIERRGNTITAWADNQQLVKLVDPDPLSGKGHDHFAFNNWQADLWFDNVSITPI
jgi:hypothetical protein